MLTIKNNFFRILILTVTHPFLMNCSSLSSILSSNTTEPTKPISNPFSGYYKDSRGEPGEAMVLRTKQGDRTLEIEIPGDAQKLSDFSIPISPNFKNGGRSVASAQSLDEKETDFYKNHLYSSTDYELTKELSKTSDEMEKKRTEIEQSLQLTEANHADGINTTLKDEPSYLGGIDHIKQLFNNKRYEAALIRTDDMIRKYQTDPKLYEMRGTLLDRIGNKELALKSWEQALRFNPSNSSLEKFVKKKRSAVNVRNM